MRSALEVAEWLDREDGNAFTTAHYYDQATRLIEFMHEGVDFMAEIDRLRAENEELKFALNYMECEKASIGHLLRIKKAAKDMFSEPLKISIGTEYKGLFGGNNGSSYESVRYLGVLGLKLTTLYNAVHGSDNK